MSLVADFEHLYLNNFFYGRLVALYLPEFHSIDSAFFKKKSNLVPTLPTSLEDLKDLPDKYF